MKISYLYIDKYLDMAEENNDKYFELEKKLKDFKEKSKRNEKILFGNQYIYFIDDATKELDYNGEYEDLYQACRNCIDGDDWTEIEGIQFDRIDCIDMVVREIEKNNPVLIDIVKNDFKNNIYDEKNILEYKLMDYCFSYVIAEKIKELEKIKKIVENQEYKINWR